jgi:hypothetical protein
MKFPDDLGLEQLLIAQERLVTAVREEMLAVMEANGATAPGRERVALRWKQLAAHLEYATTLVKERTR